MKNFQTGWYLIYTRPRHEKKVNARLIDMNITTFLPVKKTLRIWHDRKKYVDEPLFPSYVFIHLDDIQHYYEGVDVEGALYYVRSGNEIARVHDSIVENIRLLTGKTSELEVSSDHVRPGHRLVIREGALTGLACEVVEFDSRQQLLVRVELLQRNILIKMAAEQLMSIQ